VPDYITEAMLEARTGEAMLARFVQQPASSAAYTAAVLDVIERAEGRVNAYLEPLYTVPVPTSGMVEEFALAIAEWELYRRGSGNVPEKVRQSYEDALRDLRDIAKGTLGLGSTTAPTAAPEAVGLEIESATGLFDADSMEDADW
jgi:phage gp36-like protein